MVLIRGAILRRAVFLDRDGVIVRNVVRDDKPYAPRRLEDFRLLPGAGRATRALQSAGFLVIVVTNQPDIGNGFVDLETVEAMHARLRRQLAIDDIEVCPHKQTAGCNCRKPKSGMLISARSRFGIDLTRSFMVGDRDSDILAGANVGCYTVFIDRGYDRCMDRFPDCTVGSLPEAVRHILALDHGRGSIADRDWRR
jgi:D-glycero-D-manno-heptose 1,7-bisphosphate phosphatase